MCCFPVSLEEVSSREACHIDTTDDIIVWPSYDTAYCFFILQWLNPIELFKVTQAKEEGLNALKGKKIRKSNKNCNDIVSRTCSEAKLTEKP